MEIGTNGALAAYIKIYEEIAGAYRREVEKQGLALAQPNERRLLRHALAKWTNQEKSCCYGWKSPACVDCRKGEASVSFYLSLMCHRCCYYCFNPNQRQYEVFRRQKNDATAQLKTYAGQGLVLRQIALTGGEPLLHKPEAVEFFRAAARYYPKAYRRLYTSGDLLDEETLAALKDAGLDEIRFSLKLEDDETVREKVYAMIAFARRYIGAVMVEMPVIPGTEAAMRAVLERLDALGVKGINLLEFCFPFHQAEAFRQRGFSIKNPPFRVLYEYDYAAGLPVAGSEVLCMELVGFAIERKFSLGVHYCSLENKFTAQIFEQNYAYRHKVPWYFSPKDFFFKSIKAFGGDAAMVRKVFSARGIEDIQYNAQGDYAEFSPRYLSVLRRERASAAVGIAYYVVESRKDELYLRELWLEARELARLNINDL